MNRKQNCLTQSTPASDSMLNLFKKNCPNALDKSTEVSPDQKQGGSMNENTNCTYTSVQAQIPQRHFEQEQDSNAINFYDAKKMMMNRGLSIVNNDENRQNCSHTQPVNNKIKFIHTDENQTHKINEIAKAAIQQEIKKQTAVQITQKKDKRSRNKKKGSKHKNISQNQQISASIQIPTNQKIQQILNKKPLRTRFSALLKDDQKYQIGQQHMKILKILRSMDTNIQFMSQARKNRYYFFSDIKKSLYEVNRMQISIKHLQQLLFIDDQLYTVEWQINQRINNYDLMIISPDIRSEDQRVQNTRKKIVNYLIALELEFLSQRQRDKISFDGWVEGFNPNNYDIPLKSLPTHPFAQQASLRELSNSQVSAVKNHNLKRFIKDIKDQQDCKSFRSDDVVSMIFAKSTSSIKQKLYEAIRQKQAMKEQELPISDVNAVDKQVLLKICDSIMLIYMSKGVSNIFKVTLMQTLNKKTNYKPTQITQSIRIILSIKEIEFLKQIITSNKTQVLQINKSKFQQMMQYLRNRN